MEVELSRLEHKRAEISAIVAELEQMRSLFTEEQWKLLLDHDQLYELGETLGRIQTWYR